MAGARHLDYRYGPQSDKIDDLIVQHGIHWGTDYFKELQGVLKFRKDYPNEFFVLDCNVEKNISNDQKKYLIDWLVKHFGDCTLKKEDFDTWLKGFPKVPVNEIYKRPDKRILLMTDRYLFQYEEQPGQMISEEKMNQMGLWNRDGKLEARWHDKGTIEEIIQSNINYVEERPDPHKFFVAQYIITMQTKKKDIAKFFFGCDSVRVDQKQYKILSSRALQRTIRDQVNKHNMSFAMIDFMQYDPFLIHFLIGSNLKENLKIWMACVYKNKECRDVTARAKQLISNKNSLYILDFKKDFELSNSAGTFMISFSWEGVKKEGSTADEVFVEDFAFTSDTQYLLNQIRGGLKREWSLKEYGQKSRVMLGNDGDSPSKIMPGGAPQTNTDDFVSKTLALIPAELKGNIQDA